MGGRALSRAEKGQEMETDKKRNGKLTIQQFLARKESPEVAQLVGKFNGGAFMCCHTSLFTQTGIWIEELVPVFQRLDAHLAVVVEKQVRALSDYA
jgi:hypothetical protein